MKSNKPLIYLIGCSPRNHCDQQGIVDEVEDLSSEIHLYEYLEKMGRSEDISNSEGAAIGAVFGAQDENVRLKYLKLNNYFLKEGSMQNFEELYEKIEKADGYLFAQPVYFGDRPSLLQEMFDLYEINGLDFEGKVAAFLSVGAKRNGGQETSNIYAIRSFLKLGGLAVGNGPPTSQYGGTAVGGNMGTMNNDYFGILTSKGAGRKLAQTVNLLAAGEQNSSGTDLKPQIDFWITQEKESLVKKQINSLLESMDNRQVEFKVLDLTEFEFDRCFACNVCPSNMEAESDYHCINRDDAMPELHERLLEPDGIILSGLALKRDEKFRSVYQKFIERTRYIRRDDFLLTNRLATAFSLSEVTSDKSFNLRALTSIIRHNTTLTPDMKWYIDCTQKNQKKKIADSLNYFATQTAKMKKGRNSYTIDQPEYENIGFDN